MYERKVSYSMQNKRSFRGGSAPRNNPRRSRGGYGGGNKSSRTKQNIHPSRFINRTVAEPTVTADSYEPKYQFTDFALNPVIQQNLAEIGFTRPSAIQDQTIPLVLDGKDVIGLANTGTGKTAAFLLPLLTHLNVHRTFSSILIMAPTRELAQQIDDEFRRFSKGMKLFSVLLVGGVGIIPQLRGLERRPHVVIGTPGRIKDHLDRGSLRLDNVKAFVLDEADRMLDMGFVADIRRIANMLPRERQTLCFSATFSDGIRSIASDMMHNPEMVTVKVNETNDHIYQDVVHYTDKDHKRELLINLLSDEEFERVIVFGETKFGVQRLSDSIDKLGITSRAIHGNKSQSQRTRALADFKSGKVRVLFATDVAARGLDIPNVSHVINFDIPQAYDDYVHRIGRTGRAGKSGTALTFVEQQGMLRK